MSLEGSDRAHSGGGVPPSVPAHLASTVGSQMRGIMILDSNSLTIDREIQDVREFFQEMGLNIPAPELFKYPGTPEGLIGVARGKYNHPGAPVGPTYVLYIRAQNGLLVAYRSREMNLEVDARERGICRALSSGTFTSSDYIDTPLQPFFLEEAFSEWITAQYVAKKWGEKMAIAFETALDIIEARPENLLTLRQTLNDTVLEYSIPLKYVYLERENNAFTPLLGIQSYFGYILEQMIEINPALETALIDWRCDAQTIDRVFEEVRRIDPLLEEVLMSGPISKPISTSTMPTWQGDTTESIRHIHRLQKILKEKREGHSEK